MYSILPDRKQWQFGGIVCGVCESTMLIGKASEKSGPISQTSAQRAISIPKWVWKNIYNFCLISISSHIAPAGYY